MQLPNLQLIPKGASEPEDFKIIDEKICSLLNEPIHHRLWCFGWYDTVGFSLAHGETYGEIKAWIEKEFDERHFKLELLKICSFLETNYSTRIRG